MIGIVVALPAEAKLVKEKINNASSIMLGDKPAVSGVLYGEEVVLAISGIGKVSAALTTQLLIDKFTPKYILNFGTCGGMNDSVNILGYYLVEKCCQCDFDLSKLDDVPIGYIQEYDRVFFPTFTNGLDFLKKSTLASCDKFICEEKDVQIINEMGASIGDMEGGAIAQVCLSNNVNLIIIKGISDVFGKGTNQEQFFSNLKAVSEGFPSIIEQVITSLK